MSAVAIANWNVRRPIPLLACLIATGFIALSIHVGMLLVGVPYPESTPPTWARWLNSFSGIVALLIVLALAQPKIARYGFVARLLIAFALLAMIRETLRGVVMNGVVTGAWTFSAITLVEPIVRMLIGALIATIAVRWVRSVPSLVVMSIAATATAIIVQIPIGSALSQLTEQYAYLSRPDAYQFPYPMVVQIPAYLSFIEPVIGTALLTMLIWDRLPGGTIARAAQIAAIVAAVKGILVATLLFSFFMKVAPLDGMLSYGQFLFEFLALGFLSALAWNAFGREK